MTDTYKSKIVEAFRDNAIRSVLLIDDEYQSYESLAESSHNLYLKINKLTDGGNQDDLINAAKENIEQYNRTKTASELVKFFHNKQKVCTVESNVTQLDVEKVRKSDLIVLDYHLSPTDKGQEANPSLQLISDLSKNKHMNIVVVYTNENLQDAWQQIGAVLYGNVDSEGQFNEQEKLNWDQYFLEWERIWETSIYKKSISTDYILQSIDIDAITFDFQELCRLQEEDPDFLPQPNHTKKLIENSLLKLNKIKAPKTEFEIHGKEAAWIQAGHIFVALKKKEDDDQPHQIWDCIEESLFNWNPSFYRIITSELQNRIEDANLSMEKVLLKNDIAQIAMLWGVLRNSKDTRELASQELLSILMADVGEIIQNDTDLLKFIIDTANNVNADLPDFIPFDRKEPNKHNTFINKILEASAANCAVENIDKSLKSNIVHEFNQQLCTKKVDVKYISTGVIVKDKNKSTYHLCIAPSCNTIPNQLTGGSVTASMSPHRPMRFIKLYKEERLEQALKKAHQSDIIFINDGEERLALKVYENDNTPAIEQGVVLNHDDELLSRNGIKKVQFAKTNDDKTLAIELREFEVVAKLRSGFASRYQNIQLQYEARIGVDFVSATIM